MAKNKSFAASVNKFVQKSHGATRAVFRQSVQEVLIDANTSDDEGGRMRVETGFLRNSLTTNLNNPAYGPSDPREDAQGNQDEAILKILDADVNDVIWAGWSANYAGPREYRDAFLFSAVSKWNSIVRKNAARMKRELS